jgi:thiol reductant ABC exporter, cydD subunit
MTTTVLAVVQCFAIAAALSQLVSNGTPLSALGLPLTLLAGSFAGRALVGYAQEAIGHRAALRTIAELRGQVLDASTRRGQRWIADGRASSTVTLVTEALDALEPYFVKFLPQLILTCLATPTTLAAVVYLDWISAVTIIVCLPLVPVFMILVGKMTQAYSSERLKAMQRLGDQLLDLLAGLSTLKALGRENAPRRRVRELGDAYARTTMKTLYVAFLSGAVLEFLATISTALVAVEVGLRMVDGNLDLFSGLAIIMLTPECFKPLREVGAQFHASADGVAAAEQVFDIVEDPAEGPALKGASSPDLAASTVFLEGLSVASPGRATVAPFELTARVEPGKVTVLRGKSGAGKSTAAAVILGLAAPTSGQATIGGTPIDSISKESLWRQVSWVPQRPAILPGTVLENIGYPLGEQIQRAAAITGFDDVVASLPNGWNTRIGHGGTGLSVGQRQRLALTRALVQPRPFVLLDEPSAHLDAASEELVTRAVRELRSTGHTVLVIAHRAALIDEADVVIDVAARTEGGCL